MSEVSNRRFVHFDGTREEFVKGGYENRYQNSIVFINANGDEYSSVIYTHGEYYGNGGVISKGDVDNSGILIGEYDGYKNRALSKVSLALGAASTAGLKGWYYKHVNINKKQIFLGSSRTKILGADTLTCTSTLYPDSKYTDSSFVSGYEVGDVISLVYNSKYEDYATITAISGNVITLDKIPFVSGDFTLGACKAVLATDPDEFSVYCIKYSYNETTKQLTVSKHDVGGVDFGGGALAEGVNNYALNIGAHAEGVQTVAKGQFSHTEGLRTQANYSAHAEGTNTFASGYSSHAEGSGAVASGNGSHAEGKSTQATSNYAHAEGRDTVASGQNSHAEGQLTEATNKNAHAEGHSTKATGESSHAEGYETQSNANYTHTEGRQTIASSNNAHAEGNATLASGHTSHAEGWKSIAGNAYTAPVINNSTTLGNYSHAEGNGTWAKGNSSHAEGRGAFASGLASHAEGDGTIASGVASHAEGRGAFASGLASHAEGDGTIASGVASHAEGYSDLIDEYSEETINLSDKLSGNTGYLSLKGYSGVGNLDLYYAYSFPNEYGNNWSIAGFGMLIHQDDLSWYISHKPTNTRIIYMDCDDYNAESFYTKNSDGNYIQYNVSDSKDVSEYDLKLIMSELCFVCTEDDVDYIEYKDVRQENSIGPYSHTGGKNCIAEAIGSFCHGEGLLSYARYQAYFGKYNIPEGDVLFGIGNGTSDTERSTIFVVTNDSAYVGDRRLVALKTLNRIPSKNTNYTIYPSTRYFIDFGGKSLTITLNLKCEFYDYYSEMYPEEYYITAYNYGNNSRLVINGTNIATGGILWANENDLTDLPYGYYAVEFCILNGNSNMSYLLGSATSYKR